jgi:hypothetical protein
VTQQELIVALTWPPPHLLPPSTARAGRYQAGRRRLSFQPDRDVTASSGAQVRRKGPLLAARRRPGGVLRLTQHRVSPPPHPQVRRCVGDSCRASAGERNVWCRAMSGASLVGATRDADI